MTWIRILTMESDVSIVKPNHIFCMGACGGNCNIISRSFGDNNSTFYNDTPTLVSAEFAGSVRSSVKSTPHVPPVPGSAGSVLLLLHDAKKGAKITVRPICQAQ